MDSEKFKKAVRRSRTASAIERQRQIAKCRGIIHRHSQFHRYAKMHSLNCGDSKCAMCGNPRKFYGDLTLQEKKFIQRQQDEDS